MSERAAFRYLLAVCIGIEALLFFWLCTLRHEAFVGFVSTPDTPEYERVGQQLAATFTLTASPRTLGYPVFLSLGYLIGGQANGPYVVIVVQLILNIVLTWGFWRLLQRLIPAVGMELRAVATLFVFWAGLGMASYLMTDFLASLFFGVFLYGLLFWRTPSGVLLSATSLAIATLTRPTFTYLPILLPVATYLVGRVTSPVARYHLVALTVFSLGATGISVAYQYQAHKYLGPSPILTLPIKENLYYGIVNAKGQGSEADYVAFEREFEADVEKRAGRQFASLSPGERETYAKEIFREQLVAHPTEIMTNYVKNFIKYLLVPVESIWMRVTGFYFSEQSYLSYVRPVLGLICLPVWLLSLIPPLGSARTNQMYYLLAIMLLVYVVGLSAISTGSGERIRFPMLAFVLPVCVWNVHRAHGYLHSLSFDVLRGRISSRHV